MVTADWWHKEMDLLERIVNEAPCFAMRSDKSGAIVPELERLAPRRRPGSVPPRAMARDRGGRAVSPGKVRAATVLRQAALIGDMLRGIASLPRESVVAFSRNPRDVAAAESYVRRALEALLDLGRHILAKGLGQGSLEYKQVAAALREAGLLDEERGAALLKMAGYRNRLVRFYDEVTTPELYEICVTGVDDVCGPRCAARLAARSPRACRPRSVAGAAGWKSRRGERLRPPRPRRLGADPLAPQSPRRGAHRALRQRLHPLLHQPAGGGRGGSGPRADHRAVAGRAAAGRRPGLPAGALHRRRTLATARLRGALPLRPPQGAWSREE